MGPYQNVVSDGMWVERLVPFNVPDRLGRSTKTGGPRQQLNKGMGLETVPSRPGRLCVLEADLAEA